jgi:hypothetical protein
VLVLTDEEIQNLTDAERRDLIGRLARPIADSGITAGDLVRARRVRVLLMGISVLVLIPWIGYLAWTLPQTYTANNWAATWIGFDAILLVLMAGTLLLGWQRRFAVILGAFATGVLLGCDAWFDVMTARPGDVGDSVASALLVELPLAVLLISGSLRMMRLAAERLWILEPGQSVWQIRIPVPRQGGRRLLLKRAA